MSSPCSLTQRTTARNSPWSAFMHSKQNILIPENPSSSVPSSCISMEKKHLCQQWELMKCVLWRATSFSATGNSIKNHVIGIIPRDYFLPWFSVPCCHPHRGLAGTEGFVPLGFTKVGPSLHLTFEGTTVSTVRVTERLRSCYLQRVGVEGQWESPQMLSCPIC